MTHFQCSQYVWSRNQGRVISIHAADSVTFAERVRVSKSRSPYEVHKSCETLFSDTATCCTFINVLVTKSVVPWNAHPDSHCSNFSCLQPIFAIWSFARRPQFFVAGRTATNLSLMFAFVQHVLFCSHSPQCFLQNFM